MTTHPTEVHAGGYMAPCGETFDTATDMGSHAALCDQCAGAAEQQRAKAIEAESERGLANRPFKRSKTARAAEIERAMGNLRAYTEDLSDEPSAAQSRRLLWALAQIERTLHLQTFGHYGQRHAHALQVQRGLSNR